MKTNITTKTVVMKMPPAEAIKCMDEICHTQLLVENDNGVKVAEDPWNLAPVFVAIMAENITSYGGSYKDAQLAVRVLFNRVASWELDWLAEFHDSGKDVYTNVYTMDNGAQYTYMRRVDAPALDILDLVMWQTWYKVSRILAPCTSVADQKDFAIDTGNAIIQDCVAKYAALEHEVWYRHCREQNVVR